MKVAIGSDHRGYEAKKQIKAIITQLGYECIDFGTDSDEPIDYTDPAYQAAFAVSKGECERAILVCGTGMGMSIAANKIRRIRAALCHDELSAQISRQHNDANVLCISGDLTNEVLLRKMVEVWLTTEFAGGRHLRRVKKIMAIENGKDPSKQKDSEGKDKS
jgi:ribose 5-phosphate isomerase B